VTLIDSTWWAAIGLVMAAVLYEAEFGSRRGLFDRNRARALTAVTLIAGFSRGRAPLLAQPAPQDLDHA
jgi:hypothetical protein